VSGSRADLVLELLLNGNAEDSSDAGLEPGLHQPGQRRRCAILARLITGERSVTELAEPFEMSLPAVSKHLRVLERAGLIARGRKAQWRPCRLDAGPLKEVAARAHQAVGRQYLLAAQTLQRILCEGAPGFQLFSHAIHQWA
jgi:DNA-binding transcriptional ArsR family regulator